MKKSKQYHQIQEINSIIRKDLGSRGIIPLIREESLWKASESLMQSDRILIVTGFCVLKPMIGETDGPPGALSLAYALTGMGKEVLVTTDRYSKRMMERSVSPSHCPYRIESVSEGSAEISQYIQETLRHFRPDHIIAIERPGRAIDGHSYSMRGERLDPMVPQLDEFFNEEYARTYGYTRISIGDGGNEMGMGNYYDEIARSLNNGKKVASITTSDILIPAGTSNWGGYGLAAAMSILQSERLVQSPAEEWETIQKMVAAGAVDGVSGECQATVDGLPVPIYLQVLEAIYHLVTVS
ncbi:DUF4392 domain-containing protein [Tindallia californiensis]|uniref:D-glutamate cyclase-like C-terminal domain-containing protein n=1 Tax=Tindallia californiensis TaxID=159292 RepID=A0A1H3QGD8_9FIRM|nr:DUF4392 domain-containing protein [Tindallia californiensis]SDZ12108.1 protein of unknown function [Tindallia californiensis]